MRFLFSISILLTSFIASGQKPDTNAVWWKETTIYQIYPRSYMDSNGDGIGDLRGIISKLDYIKNMGFETIWISPFYESPQADFGYDISNYYAIAPEYGTLATVDSLIAETHNRGMKIVFDLVLNHTSDQHPWFKESAADKTNPKADWYVWKDGRGKNGKRPPNNWYNVISRKGWHYNKDRKQWYYTAFLDCQPDLNYRNPQVQKAIFNVVSHWLTAGVDGIRLDIFNCIMEDQRFLNNPHTLTFIPNAQHLKTKFQNRIYNINDHDNLVLARHLRQMLDTFKSPTRFMVGEAVGNVKDIKFLLGDEADGLNLVFLFDMIFYNYSAKFFEGQIKAYEKDFSAPYTPTIVFGNHDNKRSIGRIKNSLPKARQLALFQLTARGVPVMYYGEEIGMENAKIRKRDALDPISHQFNAVPQFIRNAMPVPLNRDICRTPMQWDTTANAGFSNAKPWLPAGPDVKNRNVKTQAADSLSLLNTYKDLLHLRDTTAAFKSGDIMPNFFGLQAKNVLVYARHDKSSKQTFMVLINFSNKPVTINADNGMTFSKVYGLTLADTINQKQITLGTYGGIVLKVDKLTISEN